MRISAVRLAVEEVWQRLVEVEFRSRLVEVEGTDAERWSGAGWASTRSRAPREAWSGDWSRRKSPCGGPCAGDMGGGRGGRSRCTGIERTTGGSRKAPGLGRLYSEGALVVSAGDRGRACSALRRPDIRSSPRSEAHAPRCPWPPAVVRIPVLARRESVRGLAERTSLSKGSELLNGRVRGLSDSPAFPWWPSGNLYRIEIDRACKSVYPAVRSWARRAHTALVTGRVLQRGYV